MFASLRIHKYYEDLLDKTDVNRSWLAVDQSNKIIGGAAAHRYPDYCEMKGFYVSPTLKGQGIGRNIYQKVLDFAGVLPIQVDVVEYMRDTIAMYEHWGFKIDASKGYIIYPWYEWSEEARQKSRGIYMVKPGSEA